MFNREEYVKSVAGKTARAKANTKYRQSKRVKIMRAKAQVLYRQSEKGKKTEIKYRQSLEGKARDRKVKAKRKGLGFIPLNNYFEGSEGHHISQNFVIYIPEILHRSINHSIWTWQNMNVINKLAFSFL